MNRSRLSEPPDKDLISLIQQNPADHKLFRIFLEPWLGVMNRHLASKGVQYEDAQDVVAKFAVKVWRYLPKFQYRGDEALKGWLYTILERSLQNHWKEQKRLAAHLPSVSLDEEIELKDGSFAERGDILQCDLEVDSLDWEQRC